MFMLKKRNIRNNCVQNIVYRKKDNKIKEKSCLNLVWAIDSMVFFILVDFIFSVLIILLEIGKNVRIISPIQLSFAKISKSSLSISG